MDYKRINEIDVTYLITIKLSYWNNKIIQN